ncbi:hypothetical protein BAY61_17395 [Prauserella marina]|uniref:Uncharacterized protein n=1 Tax=Prauserella marina TaxID=530584 RepID=A0A222VRF2_9PSEU|nr:hypothetical protein [Prauserella marina]ASR36488.1 hypothetical protein BAY61_17395 [Prauserella marina]PWV73862.1 hypothetical protein DES30_10835 [Prauserella marina]SDD57701.1 hypothetical protein SAMN05421630_11035 [Prauserella marina]
MQRAVLSIVAVVAAAAIAAVGIAMHAFEPDVAPVARDVAPAMAKPAERQPAQPHRIRITVSGPQDTLMRVSRGNSGTTQVALRGQPFDHAFVEPAGGTGYLGIKVAAASKDPTEQPVRCVITVDDVPVADQTAAVVDESGLAQVQCRVPTPV